MRGSTPRTCPGSALPVPQARAAAWAAGAAPDPGEWLHLDVDATITIDHSDNKQNAARDLEEDLGSSPAAGVFGPPRDRRRRSIGRAAAPGQCRQQHRRRPRHRAGVGAGVAAAGLPARTPTIRAGNRFWCAAIPPVPPTPSPQACRAPGWGSPSATPSIPGCRDAVETLNARATAGIRRSIPAAASATAPGSPRPPTLVDMSSLAGRDPVDPAQGTPPPRRAAAVHRLRRAAGHRVHHRHRARCGARPARRAGTAPPPTRPRRGPHPRRPRPPGCATCPVTAPTRTPPGWRSSWPQPIWWPGRKLIGFTDHPDLATLRDRHLPLPGPARRRPHHPRRPPNPATHRRHLAVGHRHIPSMATTSGSLHLTPDTIGPDPRNPPALERPPPSDTGRPVIPNIDNQAPQADQRRIHPSRPGRTKNRG